MINKPINVDSNNVMNSFVKTDDILKDMCGIIESSQKATHQAVNATLVRRNWLPGYRIASEEMQGEERAKYGAEIIKKLSKELSAEYGKGYAFVARQQHIHTEKQDYFIDLVFYNYILKCFVLTRMKILQSILCYTVMNNYLLLNINFISQRKKN